MFSQLMESARAAYMPHGACYLWDETVLWLHVGSDSIIALAYYSIPFSLLYFVQKRRGLPYRWMFVMFGVFIFACGTTHVMGVYTVWNPAYWTEGFIKLFTAGISLASAIALVPLIPKALALPSPEELATANAALEREVRERQIVQQELSEERRYLRAVLDSVNEGIIACDREDRVRLINPALRRLCGLPRERPMDQTDWEDRLRRPDGGAVEPDQSPLSRAARGEEVAEAELVIRHDDGGERIVLATGQPILDSDGRKLGTVVAMYDLTQRKQLENDLFNSRKLESVGQLAGGVAHDFNNVTTVVRGYAELAQRALPEGHRAAESIGQILEATRRAEDLTSQLLTISRKQVVRPQVVDSSALLGNLQRMLERVIREDIDLRVDTTEASACVLADPGQLGQVVLNLVVNARDAMPQGGRLSISTEIVTVAAADGAQQSLASGDYVRLAVSDTGVGLTDDVKQHLFEPFFTTKAPGRGTGLGLATSHGIIAQSHGIIRAEGDPGRGATFEVLLPRVDGPAETAPAADPSPHAPEGTETVLLVEDEPALRALSAQMLGENGYRVIEAGDGEQALSRAMSLSPGALDVVVTDVILPKLSGKTLADRLLREFPGLKVLYMSGYTADALSGGDLLDSNTRLLSKPFSMRSLLRELRRLLDEDG